MDAKKGAKMRRSPLKVIIVVLISLLGCADTINCSISDNEAYDYLEGDDYWDKMFGGDTSWHDEETNQPLATTPKAPVALPVCERGQACATLRDLSLLAQDGEQPQVQVMEYCQCPPDAGASRCPLGLGQDSERSRRFGGGFLEQKFCHDIAHSPICQPGQIAERHLESEDKYFYMCRCESTQGGSGNGLTRVGQKDKYDLYICDMPGRAVVSEWPVEEVKHIYPPYVDNGDGMPVCSKSQSCSITLELGTKDRGGGLSSSHYNEQVATTQWTQAVVRHVCRCSNNIGTQPCNGKPGKQHSNQLTTKAEVGTFWASQCPTAAAMRPCKGGELSSLEDVKENVFVFCTCKKPLQKQVQILSGGRVQVFCSSYTKSKIKSLYKNNVI